MKLYLYSVRDIKVGYRSPLLMHNDEEAIRSCKLAVNNGPRESEFALCPQDFELWKIGSFDDSTGVIEPCNEFVVGLGDCVVHVAKQEV